MNALISQLSSMVELILIVLKPALLVYIGLYLFLITPIEKQSNDIVCKASGLFVLQCIAITLLTIGAVPPIVVTISANQLQPSWYLAYITTFISGGLLFLWVDNNIRTLPVVTKQIVQELLRGGVRIVGIISIAFALISISVAIINSRINVAGWWAIPATLLGYGLLLNWLMSKKVKKNTSITLKKAKTTRAVKVTPKAVQ